MVQNTHNKNKKESKLRVATKLPWLPRGLVIRTKRKYMNRNIDYMKMNEVYKNLKSKKRKFKIVLQKRILTQKKLKRFQLSWDY